MILREYNNVHEARIALLHANILQNLPVIDL